MKEKATIYDLFRMCKSFSACDECPLHKNCFILLDVTTEQFDKKNEIILKWCKEHPVKTRQDKFLEMFPNAHIDTDGVLEIQPCHIDETAECGSKDDCDMCRSKYWLAEVEE